MLKTLIIASATFHGGSIAVPILSVHSYVGSDTARSEMLLKNALSEKMIFALKKAIFRIFR